MNTKQPLFEGVRRIVLAVWPMLWMLGALIGNLGDLSYTELAYCILIGAISSIVFFLIPGVIAKIVYWIIDGFCEDKNRGRGTLNLNYIRVAMELCLSTYPEIYIWDLQKASR